MLRDSPAAAHDCPCLCRALTAWHATQGVGLPAMLLSALLHCTGQASMLLGTTQQTWAHRLGKKLVSSGQCGPSSQFPKM